MSERVWLKHPVTGGYFHCPDKAVDAWREMGWEPSDPPPPPVNPSVAENLAWRAAQAAQAHQDKTVKPEKPARRGEPQE